MRPRRHVEAGPRSRSWPRVLRDIALVALVFAVGYLAAALWMSPAPLLGGADHAVPGVVGLREAEARDQLAALGFRPRVEGTRTHPSLPAGVVIWQDPPTGVVLSSNSVVTLVLSAGAAPVPVPDVIGLDTATARQVLAAAGIKLREIVMITGRQKAGVVVATRPATGVPRSRGAGITLVVSRGIRHPTGEGQP